MGKNRTKTELFVEILNKIKTDKIRFRAELSREVRTDFPLFDKIVQHMVDGGLIKRTYGYDPQSERPNRQREQLEIMPAADNETLVINTLAKVLAPTLSEAFSEWADRKHGAVDHRTIGELQQDSEKTKTFELFRRLFKSEESKK